ncbi:MAG: glycine cleavage T C-terminal barrel domain-containing protein [Zavarzinella sp.]
MHSQNDSEVESKRDVLVGNRTIPWMVSGLEQEYWQLHQSSGFIDCSHAQWVKLSGRDAAAFLHNLSTNDIMGLSDQHWCTTFFCDHRAKTLFFCEVYKKISKEGSIFELKIDAPYAPELFAHLDKHLISEVVTIEMLNPPRAVFLICGATAGAWIEENLGVPAEQLPQRQIIESKIADIPVSLCTDSRLGFPGIAIHVSEEFAGQLIQLFRDNFLPQIGLKCYDTCRLEAGMPKLGKDFDNNRFVMEIGRALESVSYSKGCYLGQEPIVMSRDRTGFVNRSWVLMKAISSIEIQPQSEVISEELAPIGIVTSTAWSPGLDGWIVGAYLRRGFQNAGTNVKIRSGDSEIEASVLGTVAGNKRITM